MRRLNPAALTPAALTPAALTPAALTPAALTSTALVPLAVVATGLSGSMWLRAFPPTTLAIPLLGAAVLSVVVAVLTVRTSGRSMAWTGPISVLAFVAYMMLVLRSPLDFAALVRGFIESPAQLLSFALPMVSPRSLLVWPVALCWLAGALAGESLARSRMALLPYGAWLLVFGVGFAGSSRAMASEASTRQRLDLALAAGLLLTMALLRVAQSWLRQEGSADTAQSTEPGTKSGLPLRGVISGMATSLVVVAVVGVLATGSVFQGDPAKLKRVPALIRAEPTTPLAFVASMRLESQSAAGTPVFDVTVDRAVPGYLGIASVDYYDGDSWSFSRDFRPSGGVVPADTDPALVPSAAPVKQQYSIRSALLTGTPWMPTIYRAQLVSGLLVSVDPTSGMIVPTGRLTVGQDYDVRSTPSTQTLSELPATWLPATSTPPIDEQIPGPVRVILASVITSFETETGQSPSAPDAFLQEVVTDLRSQYLLARAPTGSAAPAASAASTASRPSPSASKKRPAKALPHPTPSATPVATTSAAVAGTAIGGTSLSAVLAAVLGPQRTATPEQYATLCALLARALGIPARVVSGFRVTTADGGHVLSPGIHTVTTRDAYTWVEVPVRGAGWVVLDPSPSRYAASDAQPSVGAARSSSPSPTLSQAPLVTESAGGHAVAPRSAVELHARGTHHFRWYLPPLGALSAGVLLVLTLLGRRRVRQVRRRRLRDSRLLVIAAWQETLDVLEECGLGDLTTLTSVEVSRAVDERFGPIPAGQVHVVGDAADLATFSEHSVIVELNATQAWAAQRAASRSIRASLPLRERLFSYIRFPRKGSTAARALPPSGEKLNAESVSKVPAGRD
jgi:Transglutaminase-like superfamily